MANTAFDIMREWDVEAGIDPRSDRDLEIDVAGSLKGEWDEWMEALQSGEVDAIAEGRKVWGLSPL